MHRLLDRQLAGVAHPVGEQVERRARAAEHLEVRAGVGAAEDHVGPGEERAVLRIALLGGHAPGVELGVPGADAVREHPVGEHVGRVLGAFVGQGP